MATTTLTYNQAVRIAQNLPSIQGEPPETGWWMTQFWNNVPKMRWWNGKHWSVYVTQHDADIGILDQDAAVQTGHAPYEISYFPRFWEGQ